MPKTTRTFECAGCGNLVTKKSAKPSRYCSLDCYRKSERPSRKNGKELPCAVCGKLSYYPKSLIEEGRVRFCGESHFFEWWGRTKDIYQCEVCGKTFKWSPSRKQSNNIRFCSIKCRNESPGFIKRLSEMRRSQQVTKKNKIEITGEKILTELGIDFQSQFVVEDRFCVDVFIPSHKIVIQFDGDYWHGHPKKFNSNDLRQKKRMALDISQDAYMAKLGYRIIRFWESTIKSNPDFVREKIASIVIKGDLDDYACGVSSIRF